MERLVLTVIEFKNNEPKKCLGVFYNEGEAESVILNAYDKYSKALPIRLGFERLGDHLSAKLELPDETKYEWKTIYGARDDYKKFNVSLEGPMLPSEYTEPDFCIDVDNSHPEAKNLEEV